jgi:lysophospholipase L1-like esterase
VTNVPTFDPWHAIRAAAAVQPVVVAEEEQTSATFLGDSWTVGEGATALRGYAVLVGEQLGRHYHLLGVGGSGYTRPGFGSTFDQRVDQAVGTEPDVLVVQGTLNGQRTPLEQLAPAAQATLARLRTAVDEDTVVLVRRQNLSPSRRRRPTRQRWRRRRRPATATVSGRSSRSSTPRPISTASRGTTWSASRAANRG